MRQSGLNVAHQLAVGQKYRVSKKALLKEKCSQNGGFSFWSTANDQEQPWLTSSGRSSLKSWCTETLLASGSSQRDAWKTVEMKHWNIHVWKKCNIYTAHGKRKKQEKGPTVCLLEYVFWTILSYCSSAYVYCSSTSSRFFGPPTMPRHHEPKQH